MHQIDWEIVMQRLSDIPGVENVHDLHIWSISSKSISLTCHIRVRVVLILVFIRNR
jgi:Co/Zn/Cd efflux system component